MSAPGRRILISRAAVGQQGKGQRPGALSGFVATVRPALADEQGARLSRTPTYDELRSYRGLIQRFGGEVVNNMYEMTSQAGWDRMGRRKVYTTVRKIDKKLEEMAESIRLGQADQLSIIASHDAIRGLLVDLYS